MNTELREAEQMLEEVGLDQNQVDDILRQDIPDDVLLLNRIRNRKQLKHNKMLEA